MLSESSWKAVLSNWAFCCDPCGSPPLKMLFKHNMCSFGEKNFFDGFAEVVGNALFDLISGNAFAALIHKERRRANFKRVCNGFCIQGAA